MATFNIEIRALPDDLKCAECKSVLKDACQVPCGCQFCRTCIDGLMARGGQFCPRGSQECGRTPLSTAVPDFKANKSVMKLTAKCPHSGCTHECPLADIEGHLRVCPHASSHMQQERGSQSEILMGMVGSIITGLEMVQSELAWRDKQMGHLENEIKSMKEENQSMKDYNKFIKDENESMVAKINGDMEMLKQELMMKDEHLEKEIKSIKDEIKSIKNENKAIKDENKLIREENESMKNEIRSIKIENESIKRENAVLTEEVRLLAENLDRERDERANAGISTVTEAVASNRNALGAEMEPVRGDIRSIKGQLDSMRCQMESMQVAVGLVQLADWLIDEDVGKTEWVHKTSTKFRGGGRSHTYELASWNSVRGGELGIWLRIWAGPSDAQLQWPFRGAVTITVAHRDNAEKCVRQTRECQIKMPPDNHYSDMEGEFTIGHAALRGAGLDLERGVRVSCQIVPGAGQ